jgi:phytoene dehydrogenase-like protein
VTSPAPDLLPRAFDVAVIGAGHNGLVAAAVLQRAGLQTAVFEAAEVVGGACRTETPFARAPGLRQSTGAYLLGLMPPEILADLDLDLPLIRRDPHYFLPTTGPRFLLLGADAAANEEQFKAFFSERDWKADQALGAELGALRDDLAPALLQEPLPLEETAERFIRPQLRQVFLDLSRGSVSDYLDRFGFQSELVKAMYLVTDGLTGHTGGPDTPGSGQNFLVHNLCRLPGAGGTWMLVRGGMGTVTQALAAAARRAGAVIETGSPVTALLTQDGAASGVVLAGGREVRARAVLAACDPFRLLGIGGDAIPAALRTRVESERRTGTTLKVNLALSDLPRFTCLAEGDLRPFGTTIHILPEEGTMGALRRMWDEVQAGRLPDLPPIEWYVHTTLDPSLRDAQGNHSSALFVQSVPYAPADTTWEDALDGYVDHLLEICDRFAPGTSELVVDRFALPPPGIESHFGITGGHIFHLDNSYSFTDRVPYATGLPGLYAGGSGCHPAGSVMGAPGYNAAQRLLRDVGVPVA